MLSYEDAETLARFGAKVLHPKTMEPAAARAFPYACAIQKTGEPGTRIDALGAEDGTHAAVASRDGLSLVQMTPRGRGAEGSFAVRALQSLSDANVAIVLGEIHGDRLLVAVDRAFDEDAFRARVDGFAEGARALRLAAVCAWGTARHRPRPGDGGLERARRPAGASRFAPGRLGVVRRARRRRRRAHAGGAAARLVLVEHGTSPSRRSGRDAAFAKASRFARSARGQAARPASVAWSGR
jgi:hypothetical protein